MFLTDNIYCLPRYDNRTEQISKKYDIRSGLNYKSNEQKGLLLTKNKYPL